MNQKEHLTNLSKAELTKFVSALGEPKYRADQIFKALHQRRILDFDEITDLPKSFRTKLHECALVSSLELESRYKSADGTRRYLLKTAKGNPVETVYIPSDRRDTICFSSQSGCALMCDFCLTARLGFLENLVAGQIIEQIIIVLNDVYGAGGELPHGINLVAMGAGEPFQNFENLAKAVEIMSEEDGLFIVPNRITVSTVGIVPKIYEFAKLDKRPRLAISLTAPNDELRSSLMPVNNKWNLDDLMNAAKDFEKCLRRGERFTFEYVLLKDVNDSNSHAIELAKLLAKNDLVHVMVNLIPYNSAKDNEYDAPAAERVAEFQATLRQMKVSAYIRTPRGQDIFAACGQLAAVRESELATK